MNTALKKHQLPLRVIVMCLMALSVVLVLALSITGGSFFARLLVLLGLREEDNAVTAFLLSGESFAMAGDKLAVASSVGAQLMDENAVLLSAESFAMDDPAVSASGALSVFYDVGGKAMCVISASGESVLCPAENRIRFADASDTGYVTVVTDAPDYRGRVTVYNASFSPVFTLDCGVSGYPINARVSPGEYLLVNCAGPAGSTLRFFSLHSETELACLDTGERLILDFDFLEDGTVAVLTEEALYLLTEKGEQRACIELEGEVLADYCFTGRNALLLLHDGLTGNSGRLLSISSRGETVGELETDRPVCSLSAKGRQILVLYPSELTLYHEDFREDISYQRVANSTLCLLAAESRALLLGRSGGELIRFCD